MKLKIVLLFVLSFTFSSAVAGQQRWFENAPGSFKRVQWENVAIVIFYNAQDSSFNIGAHIFTSVDGKFDDWGTIPKGSPSLNKLFNLIEGSKPRWVKMQPHQQGSYLRPNQAVGYADMKTIIGFTKVTPIEFGQEVYAITFENFNGRGAVVDVTEKARIEKLIADSQNP